MNDIVQNPVLEVYEHWETYIQTIVGNNYSMEWSTKVEELPWALLFLMGTPTRQADLEGHDRIDKPRKEDKAVVGAEQFLLCEKLVVFELVHVAAAAEAEAFEDFERSRGVQAVHVHDAGGLDHVVRIVLLVDADRDAVRLAGDLCDGVADETVIIFSVIGSDDVETVTDLEESCQIVLVRGFLMLVDIVCAEFRSQVLDLLF